MATRSHSLYLEREKANRRLSREGNTDKQPEPCDTKEDTATNGPSRHHDSTRSNAPGGMRPQLTNELVLRHFELGTVQSADGRREEGFLFEDGLANVVGYSPTANSETFDSLSSRRMMGSAVSPDIVPERSSGGTNKRKPSFDSDSEGSLIARKRDRTDDAAEQWKRTLQQFDSKCEDLSIGGKRGHTRTNEECCLLILAIKSTLKWMLQVDKAREGLKWTSVEQAVARDFKVDPGFVNRLRVGILEHDRVAVREVKKRGAAAEKYKSSAKLNEEDLEELRQYILSKDEQKRGITPTYKELGDWVESRINQRVSRSSVQRYLAKIGIQYKREKETSTAATARNGIIDDTVLADPRNEEGKDDGKDDSNRRTMSEQDHDGATNLKKPTPTPRRPVVQQPEDPHRRDGATRPDNIDHAVFSAPPSPTPLVPSDPLDPDVVRALALLRQPIYDDTSTEQTLALTPL